MREANALYFDHAATSPMRPEALEAMLPFLGAEFGNPSGLHATARRARRALDEARDELADALGCAGDELVFTSGATEADNLALAGAVASPGRLVVSAVEHAAVLRPAERLGARLCPVDARGLVDPGELGALVDGATELVSVMLVNSEVGVVEPVADVADVVRASTGRALVHCDAAQGLTWCDVATATAQCDLVSVSGHKFGGPKGIGALVVRPRAAARLRPLLLGGGQERELRAGTPNVAGAVAMARAASFARAERDEVNARVGTLAGAFGDGVRARRPEVVETVPRALRVAGSCHLRFPGTDAEELVLVLDELGLACSTGAACAAGATEPSHVLLAMGLDKGEAREAVRFSLGTTTTPAEVAAAIELVEIALARLGH